MKVLVLIIILIKDFSFNERSLFILISFFFPVGEEDSEESENNFIDKWNEVWNQEIDQKQTSHKIK